MVKLEAIKENEKKQAYIMYRKGLFLRYRGIAQQVIKIAENLFSANKRWCLDTIKQEKNNCHLYEKLGYTPCGVERKINKRMTIIKYEKRIN